MLAAASCGLRRLPLTAIDDRPTEYAELTPLAWYILWLGSNGYGTQQVQQLWQGSASHGWVKEVAVEIRALLERRGLPVPYPKAWPSAALRSP